MIPILLSRWRQGHRTLPYPASLPALPDRFRGRPLLPSGCAEDCGACAAACPTGALGCSGEEEGGGPGPALDLGRCLFCGACSEACEGAGAKGGAGTDEGRVLRFSGDHRLAARQREDLRVRGDLPALPMEALEPERLKLFKRSLKLRVVSAGGCNGCEVDTNVLGTLAWDLGRFGIQVVASPRHADAIVVCGPVTRNMELGLKKTYDATPAPKLVIAVGACAIAGGPYLNQAEQCGGAQGAGLDVDLFIPGCPPHPLTILDGLLRLLDRIPEGQG